MITYKEITYGEGEYAFTFIQSTNENGQVWGIPKDPTNSDYQAYLASLEAPTE